jgi:hypothetical protein
MKVEGYVEISEDEAYDLHTSVNCDGIGCHDCPVNAPYMKFNIKRDLTDDNMAKITRSGNIKMGGQAILDMICQKIDCDIDCESCIVNGDSFKVRVKKDCS